MVNIFEKYGIKEVANVYFEALDNDPSNNIEKGDIVLFLDTLKVSTIETTAESTEARGGWGNPKLVMWDYGKEINLTLEDALISLESLRFMMGGAIKQANKDKETVVTVSLSEQGALKEGGALPKLYDHLDSNVEYDMASISEFRFINMTKGVRGYVHAARDLNNDGDKTDFGEEANAWADYVEEHNFEAGDLVRFFWTKEVKNDADAAVEITISPNTFPGTYKVVGDTFMRSEATGKDEPFQFVIGKAKVLSEVTITLEAEGDPSTFEMQLNVLRSTNERGENEMMKLIRYNAADVNADEVEQA